MIVSDDVRRLITAPTTLDIPTMKGKARLLTLPRAIANADSNAAVTALANPGHKELQRLADSPKGREAHEHERCDQRCKENDDTKHTGYYV